MNSRLLYAGVASLAGIAFAAPAMAQEGPAAAYSGWYIGGNLGGVWGDNSLNAHASPGTATGPTNPIVIPPADQALINAGGGGNSNKTGFTGGVEGGYNYVAGNWLFGIETEFSALDVNESQQNNYQSTLSPAVSYSITQRAKTNWMWTLRPRVGVISGPWLFYGTAGIASADIKVALNYSDTRTPANVANTESSSTRTGWAGGLGGAYAFGPQWSVKGEWLYADFGSISTTASSSSGFVDVTSEGKVRANIFRFGMDYRF